MSAAGHDHEAASADHRYQGLIVEDQRGRVAMRRLGLVVPRLATFGEDAQGRVYAASRHGTAYRLKTAP